MNRLLSFSPEVRNALDSGKPVVALESTIIAHGMPYPVNVQTACEVEDIVRSNGAVPATIALMDGTIRVGLTKDELDFFGSSKDVWKVSVRDIPFVIAKKIPGATTVAATVRIAGMAGINIMVTGGIGGVHRGAQETLDISNDLTELSRTNVVVISAGMKSILDIGVTLEYLETKGVPVVTMGQDTFPSFYSRESGFASPLRMDDPVEIARLISAKWELGLEGGIVIANPIPAGDEIPFSEMEKVIDEALASATKHNVSGKRVTPYLLQYIVEKTGGRSLKANVGLVKNNAKLGSKIACLLATGK